MLVQVINGVGIAGIGTGSSSQSGGGSSSSFDTDAQAFITAASITATTQQNAVNDLVLDLKASSLWTKMKALYPMVGGTSLSHKWNLKDPRDLDAAFRLTFAGGWTHSSTGALPNGTDGYANTNLNPSTNLTSNSHHLSFYSRTNNTTTASDMACQSIQSSSSQYGYMTLSAYDTGTSRYQQQTQNTNAITVSEANTLGFYQGSRTSSTSFKGYKNGVVRGTNTNVASSIGSYLPVTSIVIGAFNFLNNSNATSVSSYSNRETAFASIGDGLTDLESNLFYQIVEKFQYALGRNVNASKSFYFNRNYSLETNAFIFNGGITGSTEISATDTLVSDLKASGLWTKMKALYPMVGGTALAHKFNLVNPIDSTSAFTLTFNGGWTHSSTGALPNGSNAYADTFLIPSNNFDTISFSHISYYSRTNSSRVTDVVMGSYNSVGVFGMYNLYSRRDYMGFHHDYPNTISYRVADISGTFDTRGFTCGTLNATNAKLFKNNVLVSSNTSARVSSSIVSNLKSYIGAFNRDGSASQFTDKECAFASMGTHLTDIESSLFYQIVEKFQSALGRNVNATQPFYYNSSYTNETNAFIFNGAVTDATQISAVNTLVTTLKTAGIWSKMKAVYPMVGGTATAHKFNLVNPIDATSAYALTFNGGWTHSSTGALPNGTTGYANTGLAPGTIGMSSSSLHLSYYSRTTSANGTSRVCIGSTNGVDANNNVTILAFGNSGTAEIGSIAGRLDGTGYSPTTTLTNYIGLKFVTVNGNRNARYYKNGVFIPNQVSQTGNLDQYPLYLSAINRYNTVVDTFNNQQCAFASIGDGLTDAEATTFYNAVQSFQTTLGRQV